jgi:polyphosphate kinase
VCVCVCVCVCVAECALSLTALLDEKLIDQLYDASQVCIVMLYVRGMMYVCVI